MIPSASSPTPAEIIALRAAHGLTQGKIAQLLHANDRTWRQWEAGDRRMHPVFWEFLQIKLRKK